MTKARDTEEIKEIVNDYGYVLLDDYFPCGGKQRRVIVQDNLGYKYDIAFQEFKKQNRGLCLVGTNHPFSLYNISLWLKLNNKDFELCDKSIYKYGKSLLLFYCFKCNDYFNMSWSHIYGGIGCAVCSGHQTGIRHSLAYLKPELMNEWHPKNKLTSNDVTIGSNRSVLWICSICGYGLNEDWITSVSHRTKGGGCPACSGNVVSDLNRLSVLYPYIAGEWHKTKNGKLTPYDVSYGSNKKFWWLCSEGHEYQSAICTRTINGCGCKICVQSKGEDKISFFLNKDNILYETEKNFLDCRNIFPLFFDFYLKDYNLCIEYDGILHYEDKFNQPKEFEKVQNRDRLKNNYCRNNNINLLRIPYWNFNRIEEILKKELNI